ncbi:MAG: hypothetical protein AB1Y26_03580 [Cycloclasticus sp.]
MNIQANLSNVGLITNTKKAVTKQPVSNEGLDQKQATDSQQSAQLSFNGVDRAELFEQIESLDNSQQTSFRASDIENKNQKSIQYYIDNQALENQETRDELREQLGIDFTV